MQRHCWKDASCGALRKLAEWLWITRKSVLLNWNSSTVNIRENRSGKYLKLLKYSTASLYRESALGLPFGQNLRHHLYSTRPWGSDTETLVVYGLLVDIYYPSKTTWICNSTCWGRCIPIRSHCPVRVCTCIRSYLGFYILYVTTGARHIHDHYLPEYSQLECTNCLI